MVFWGESRAFWVCRGLSCYAGFVAGFVASGEGATALAAVGDRRDKVRFVSKGRYHAQSCLIIRIIGQCA